MSNPTVDFAALSAAITRLNTLYGAADTSGITIAAQLTGLATTWTGDSGQAFETGIQDWLISFNGALTHLSAIIDQLELAHKNFTNTSDSIGQSWS